MMVRGNAARLFGMLERVPERVVAEALLVDREVALEHAAVGSEQLDRGLDGGLPRLGELGRARPGRSVEAEPVDRHPHATHLEHRVRASGDVGEVALPLVEDRGARLGRRFVGNRAAEMIDDEGQVREGVERVGELGELRWNSQTS